MNNKLEEKLISSYVGTRYNELKNKRFSFSSLFLGWYYLAYRKFYSLLIIYVILYIIYTTTFLNVLTKETILEKPILVIFIFVPSIILAVIFNKLYLNNVKKQVNKIKDSNTNASEEELINLCSKKGGTSIVPVIVTFFIVPLVSGILSEVISSIIKAI